MSLRMLAPAVFVLLLDGSGIQVAGTSDCPTPLQVEQAYAALATVSARNDKARFEVVGDEVVMHVTSSQGFVLGEKRLQRSQKCEDLASAFALSLATLQNEVAYANSPTLAEQTPAPVRVPPRWWNVGLAVGIASTAKLSSPALRVLLLGRWQATRAGALRASLGTGSEQSLALGPGQARWSRSILALGWDQEVLHTPRLSLFGAALLAWLQVRGEGFVSNRDSAVFDPGFEFGGHGLVHRFAALDLWMEAGAAVWPRGHHVVTPAENPTKSLPITELFLRLGLAVGVR